MTLVSDGAECIVVSKEFFKKHMNEDYRQKLCTTVSLINLELLALRPQQLSRNVTGYPGVIQILSNIRVLAEPCSLQMFGYEVLSFCVKPFSLLRCNYRPRIQVLQNSASRNDGQGLIETICLCWPVVQTP